MDRHNEERETEGNIPMGQKKTRFPWGEDTGGAWARGGGAVYAMDPNCHTVAVILTYSALLRDKRDKWNGSPGTCIPGFAPPPSPAAGGGTHQGLGLGAEAAEQLPIVGLRIAAVGRRARLGAVAEDHCGTGPRWQSGDGHSKDLGETMCDVHTK